MQIQALAASLPEPLSRRSLVFASVGMAAMLCTQVVHAQAFPNKPIKIISAFAAASGPDSAMRPLAEKLAEQLGQQVVIEPKPGGNGLIAMGALKQVPADGHTLLLLSNAHMAINPALHKNPAYQFEGLVEPVSTIYRAPFFIATSATSPYRTLGELIAAAKSSPNRVSFSIPYVGSPPHLGSAFFEHLTKSEVLEVSFKDAQVVTSVASGEVDATMATLGGFNALVKGGKLRLLAVAQPARSSSEPSVPTVEEAGGPRGLTVESWVGLFAPRGTPPQALERMSKEVARALASPDMAQRYHTAGVTPTAMSPSQMKALIKEDARRYANLVKQVGMKIE